MTDYPWFKFEVAQERALLDVMTDEQYTVHTRLRVHAWTTGSIPNAEDELRTITRTSAVRWRRIWPVVSRHWAELEADPRRLVNERQEEERLDAEARKTHGKRAIEERWKRTREKALSNTRVVPEKYQDSTGQDSTRQNKTESSLTLALVAREPAAIELSSGQLQAAVPGLVGAWNNFCAVPHSPFVAVTVRSHPKATAALRAHPNIDWWADLFGRVGASDFLRRDAQIAPADLWWVLDHADEIAAGRYDNRQHKSKTAAALAEALKGLA